MGERGERSQLKRGRGDADNRSGMGSKSAPASGRVLISFRSAIRATPRRPMFKLFKLTLALFSFARVLIVDLHAEMSFWHDFL